MKISAYDSMNRTADKIASNPLAPTKCNVLDGQSPNPAAPAPATRKSRRAKGSASNQASY